MSVGVSLESQEAIPLAFKNNQPSRWLSTSDPFYLVWDDKWGNNINPVSVDTSSSRNSMKYVQKPQTVEIDNTT